MKSSCYSVTHIRRCGEFQVVSAATCRRASRKRCGTGRGRRSREGTSEKRGDGGAGRRLRVAVFTVCSCVRGRFFDNQRRTENPSRGWGRRSHGRRGRSCMSLRVGAIDRCVHCVYCVRGADGERRRLLLC
ncbi:hypothetical protein LXL04_006382 [Taraxacum kok-saghyz]